MIRFIINFILFGFLFFLIWHFFPDAFKTMASWAEAVYNFLRDSIFWITGKVKGT